MSETILPKDKNTLLQEAIKQTIHRTQEIIAGQEVPSLIKGENIFMGVGIITGSGKLSQGLGLGFINMACLARELQKNAQIFGINPHIIVLIANEHANAGNNTHLTQQIHSAVHAVFKFIGTDKASLQVIPASIDSWPKNGSTYAFREAGDIMHAHQNLGCGFKIGWQSKRQPLSRTVIRDEKWFEDQALRIHSELNQMAFLRTPEWMSLQTHTGDHNLPLPPYFGDNADFVIGAPIDLTEWKNKMTKQMKRALGRISSGLGHVLSFQDTKKDVLQELLNFCEGEI